MRPDGATAGSRAHEAVVVTAPATVSPVTPADIARAAEGPTPMSSETVYFEYQVEQPVSPKPGNPVPRYPDMLRSANVEGTVLAQFVVDPDGMPEMSTFKVVRSTHDLFTSAVKSALPEMRFNPAQVGGKGVYQLVQMPFEFNLTR